MSALEKQVGGKHYKNLTYQPVKLAADADLNFFQTSILKYVLRYKNKNGLEDLEKGKHYAELGQELKPANHANLTFAHIFISANNLSSIMAELVYAVFKQYWDVVKLLIGDLVLKES